MKKNGRIVRGALGFFGSMALAASLSINPGQGREAVAYSNSFLAFFFGLLAAACFVRVKEAVNHEDRRGFWLSLLSALMFALALTMGKQLETKSNLDLTDVLSWISFPVTAFFLQPFLQAAWGYLEAAGRRNRSETEEKDNVCFFLNRRFWLYWFVLLLCWLPVFLAFYPGAFAYDAQEEYVQVAARAFTTHHPLLHVLLLGGFVAGGGKYLGSYNLGIACYTVMQMLILAGAFSYTLLWLRRRLGSGRVSAAGLLFYGFFPVIPMYAVCSAKDTLFTAAFLVVLLQMLALFEDPGGFLAKKGNWFAAVPAAALMMLLRNNGCYAYVAWAVAAGLGMVRLFRGRGFGFGRLGAARVFLLFLVSLLAFLGVSRGLIGILGAQDGNRQEHLTVPIQQLVRTYKYCPEAYTEEEKAFLQRLFTQEGLEAYNPRLSDITKSKFDNGYYREHSREFFLLWVKTGLKKPLIYLNAWLLTSYGYWYPDALINVYGGNTVHTFTYEDSSYFAFETESPGTRESKFPWLEEQYRRLSLELYQQRAPGLSMLFSPGFLFWLYAFCLGFLLWKRAYKRLFPLSLILFLWLTVILGPTYLVRYGLILWFALPVIVCSWKLCYTNIVYGNAPGPETHGLKAGAT